MTVSRVFAPRIHDLGGGMLVRRLLPASGKQGIGPFVFFDHFGPMEVKPVDNHDVRPHPHIGLATVTYLFEGAITHRDSLGVVQKIEPGAINWMCAGRGIVHSERRPADLHEVIYTNHGLQLWVALPAEHEETAPSFSHVPATDIPTLDIDASTVRILIGEAFGLTSPVATLQPTLYLDVQARSGSILALAATSLERAVYSVDQMLSIDGTEVEPRMLAMLEPGLPAHIAAPAGARYVVIGGTGVDGHRHMWWNFVSSRQERIEKAKRDWATQTLGTIPGETEWIPLPV